QLMADDTGYKIAMSSTRGSDAANRDAPRSWIGGVTGEERGDGRETVRVCGDERANPGNATEIDRAANGGCRDRGVRRSGHPKKSTTPCYDVQGLQAVQGEVPLQFDESAGFAAPSAFGSYRVLHQTG